VSERVDRAQSLGERCRVERRGYSGYSGKTGRTMDSKMDGRIKVNSAAACDQVGEPK
jgi:hypothetical protein